MVKVDLFPWNDFWNIYGKDVPWNIEEVDENLHKFVDEKKFDKILEIGCGVGSNTDFLADHCDSIISVDISQKAIDMAKELVDKKNASFECVDFLNFSHNDKFDLIFDRGCFHGFERTTDRRKFVKKISNLLSNRGEWVSLIGSAENVMDNEGPPKWKIMDIVKAVDKHLQIKEIKQCSLKSRNGTLSPAWIVISSKRIV